MISILRTNKALYCRFSRCIMTFANDKIRNFVKEVSRGIVATVESDGQPHISVKNGRLRRDGTLELWNVFGGETVLNIEANPRVCVTFTDFNEVKGYRFKGLGKIEREGERFTKVKENLARAKWVLRALIRVHVKEVTLISQKPDEVNKKIF